MIHRNMPFLKLWMDAGHMETSSLDLSRVKWSKTTAWAGSTFLKELHDKIMPKIFGAELPDVANQIGASHAAKQASNDNFQKLLHWDMGRNKYPKFAPILYAARESDGRRIDDWTKVFMNPQLVLVSLPYLYAGSLTRYQALKSLLTGAASITKVSKYAKPKTHATLWGLLGVTPSSIACIAILVCNMNYITF